MPINKELFEQMNIALERGGDDCFIDPDAVMCQSCKRYTGARKLREAMSVCPHCGFHFRIGAAERISFTADPGTFRELFAGYSSKNPLGFAGYDEKIAAAKTVSGEIEAVKCGTAAIGGVSVAIFAMDPRFMMASMGSVVGEKITALFEYATENGLHVVGFCASGGARMQEGILSLMQMAKTNAAVSRHSAARGLFISVLTDPTTGGVTASFATRGDIILAEPAALIGFAGRRVIEQTTKSRLPDNFQSAEYLLSCGFLDNIVARREMKGALIKLLKLHTAMKGEHT